MSDRTLKERIIDNSLLSIFLFVVFGLPLIVCILLYGFWVVVPGIGAFLFYRYVLGEGGGVRGGDHGGSSLDE